MERPRRPDAHEVARRILVLSSVLARVRVECERPGADVKAGVADWLRAHDLHESASLRELKFLNAPAGRAERSEMLQLSWRVEACAMLAWAADLLHELPPWDRLVEPVTLLESLADAHADPRGFVASLRLRAWPHIETAREVAELWHWRARTTLMMAQDVKPPEGWTFDRIIREAAERGHATAGMPSPIDGDFPVLGKPYRALAPDEYATVHSIARERHFALNWLCGLAPGGEWESTPTDT